MLASWRFPTSNSHILPRATVVLGKRRRRSRLSQRLPLVEKCSFAGTIHVATHEPGVCWKSPGSPRTRSSVEILVHDCWFVRQNGIRKR